MIVLLITVIFTSVINLQQMIEDELDEHMRVLKNQIKEDDALKRAKIANKIKLDVFKRMEYQGKYEIILGLQTRNNMLLGENDLEKLLVRLNKLEIMVDNEVEDLGNHENVLKRME
ncbi:hypothetical protein ECANGB1_784 [Enterospora canceri]|uniref:Uncharacterized protein n=1 Tax=Enterospora canceri TaxID=1081671 RepID=A0A1Y1S863_9MICR|nr:hypothetical protein ECANGB1_784 [Enterospora canceri]